MARFCVYVNITYDIVTRKEKPVDTDEDVEDVEDDANPDDILLHLDPMKKNTPITSEGK